ncbi:MAG: UDP-N-acetylmuramoyl-tripeptide--D-alanyl-D-alanine ligase [Chloroflexota bacterium]|nr:UDP-N-acetylmuramoyl-tripeptide--D-alanyl-D-alanine ligase [Chloroflexota bacterium]GIK55698.1 MAG: UDP-N-acetylmuramoyl-tripeptide--D-alanyl-D-alanine ligase [Chloroflexota bacterium]
MLTLAHFFQVLMPEYAATGDEPVVSAVVMDSREVGPGCLFVAYKGEQVDGHDFVADAFARGAIAALVARPLPGDHATIDFRAGQPLPYPLPFSVTTPVCLVVSDPIAILQASARAWRARFAVQVIGITGSVGKTSTKELTHAVLAQQFNTFKSPGNRNSVLGLPMALFGLEPQHQKAVLEMAMYVPGEIATLCEMTQPEIGVVTLVGAVHLERAGSMEAIVAAKRELVEALPAHGVAILNRDDDRVMGMAGYTAARIFTYGLDERADLWADRIESRGLAGIRFVLHHGRDHLHIQAPLIGRHSVHTALRATAVGLALNMSWDSIVRGLQHTAVELRVVSAPGPKQSLIIDDSYNANPESTLAALNLLEDLPGRKVAVLGDMLELGYLEEPSHRLIGRRVADVCQVLIAVGPRARWIAEEAVNAGLSPDHVALATDAVTAVPVIEARIQPQDVILIKGSYGMRMDRIVTALGRYD